MQIAIDWDKTYTSDPQLWASIIKMMMDRGHNPVIVTRRTQADPVRAPFGVPVLYVGNNLKEPAAIRAGYNIKIWVDDQPQYIRRAAPWR